MARRKRWLSLMAAVLVFLLTGMGVAPQSSTVGAVPVDVDIAVAWFDLLYDVVKAERLSPPTASRVYGLAAVTLYEAVVHGSETHRSLMGQLNDFTGVPRPNPFLAYHWPSVANRTMAAVIRGLLPDASQTSFDAMDALEQAFAGAFAAIVRPAVTARSAAHGEAVAEAVIAWAATDGLDALNDCAYTPPAGPGVWEPTPPAFVPTPLQPCWGMLRPMVLRSGTECQPPPPPPYATDPASPFYANAVEVYETSRLLTEEQRTIAQFWADTPGTTGTPPGHWIAIMGQLARAEQLPLMIAAEGYARVGIAVADAFIGCWATKYTYYLLRPVTYIQEVLDATWLPFLVTPPFPEYSSGHATQSAAVAALLTAMFGIMPFADTLHQDHDLEPRLEPRLFSSFEQAAYEAALSRIYGGIHYPFGSDQGLVQGRCIGQMILDRVQFTK